MTTPAGLKAFAARGGRTPSEYNEAVRRVNLAVNATYAAKATNTEHAHRLAAAAHEGAAKLFKEEGRHDAVRYHEREAQTHTAAAEHLKNVRDRANDDRQKQGSGGDQPRDDQGRFASK
jgi:hypothetical protein